MTPTTEQAIELTVATFVTRPEAERVAIIEKVRFDAGEVDGMGHPELHQKQFSKALLSRLEQADKALTQAQKGEVAPAMPTRQETAAVMGWAARWVGFAVVLVGGCMVSLAFIEGAMVAVRLWAIEYGAWIGAGFAGVFVAVLALALPNPFRERDEAGGTSETFEEYEYFRHTKWEKK